MEVFDAMNVESFFGLDIAFVIDSTGSMMSYINGAKESIKEIMTQSQIRFKRFKADETLLKFGIVAYRDHPPQESSFVTKIQDFTTYQSASAFLDSLTASGGGDPPEAVLDGLNEAVHSLKWRDTSEKILFLLLDNPGHGVRFGTNYDCPCGLNESYILQTMKSKEISFHIVRPKEENHKLDKMIELFQTHICIDIMELEKQKRLIVNSDRVMNEDMEDRIFNRSRFSSLAKLNIDRYNKKYAPSMHSSESDSSNSSVISKKCRRRSRSRSHSKSKGDKMDLDKDEISGLKYRPITCERKKATEVICDDFEMNIESGIKDHISKVVIAKLNKYLNINDE